MKHDFDQGEKILAGTQAPSAGSDEPARNRIGLVTVTYNSSTVLDGFLQSTRDQDWSHYLLYVIDNASKDDSVTQVRAAAQSDERIVLIANSENLGVAAGNNQGIRAALAADCEWVLLINNDVEFPPTLFTDLLNALDEYGAEMVVPKIYYHSPNDRLWCAGGTILPQLGYAVRHYGVDQNDVGQFDRPMRIEYSPTCCMLIHRSVFLKIGIMDETFFVYGDDTDFCCRAWRAGISFWYAPTPVLYHKVSSLTGSTSDFSHVNLARGRVFLMRKYGGWLTYLWLASFQALAIARLIARKISWRTYLLQQRGFREATGLVVNHQHPR